MIKIGKNLIYNKVVYTLSLIFIIPLTIIIIFAFSFNDRQYFKLNNFSIYLNSAFLNLDLNKKVYYSNSNDASLENITPFETVISDVSIYLNNESFINNRFQIYNPFENRKLFLVDFPDSESLFYLVKYEGNFLNFYSPDQEVIVNGEKITKKGKLEFFIENVGPNDIYKFNDKYIFIKNILEGEKYTLPKTYFETNEVELFLVAPTDLLSNQNNDFSLGLWQQEVSDCSASDPGVPLVGMGITNTIFGSSLNLYSKNHFACTMKRFSIKEIDDPSQKFIFNLNYKNNKSNTGAYFIKFIDKTQKNIFDEIGNIKTIIPEKSYIGNLNNSNKNWVSSSAYYEPKLNNPFFIDIYLYSQSYGLESNIEFDNISLFRVTDFKKVLLNKNNINNDDLLNVNFEHGYNDVILPIAQNNIIENDNFSFEQDTWQTYPIDCSNSDPGEPKFTLSSSSDSTNGIKSVMISSENHSACIYRKFKPLFNKNLIYELSFDYKIIEGKSGLYFIRVKGQNSNETETFSSSFSPSDSKWNTVSLLINNEIYDIESIEIYFYSNGTINKSTILYDNVQIKGVYPRNFSEYVFKYKNENLISTNIPQKLNFTVGKFIDTIYSDENTLAFYTNDILKQDQLSENAYLLSNENQSFVFGNFKNGRLDVSTSKIQTLKFFLFYYYIGIFCVYFFIKLIFNFERILSMLNNILKKYYKFSVIVLYTVLIVMGLLILIFFNIFMGFYFLCGILIIYLKFNLQFIKTVSILFIVISAILMILNKYYLAENFIIYGFYSIGILLLQEFVVNLENLLKNKK